MASGAKETMTRNEVHMALGSGHALGGRSLPHRTPRIALTAALSLLLLALVPVALAKGKPGGGGGGGGSCTPSAPTVTVDNNWSWSGNGTYGLPGQRLQYMIHITNNSCSSSTFTVGVSAPSGFSVSLPTSSISLGAKTVGYLSAYVTSSAGTADGDYPIDVSMSSSGSTVSSVTSWYKVYSADSTAPTLFWPAPGDGATISGRSYNVGIQATDDHSVKSVDVYIDGALKQSTSCADISYTCQSIYTWATRSGAHTATFRATDWMGNVATQTVSFTVG